MFQLHCGINSFFVDWLVNLTTVSGMLKIAPVEILKTVWSPAFPVTLSTIVYFSRPVLPFCKMKGLLTVSSRTSDNHCGSVLSICVIPVERWIKGEIGANIWQSCLCGLTDTCSKGFLYLPVLEESIFATWKFFGISGIKVNELECQWWNGGLL